jgi:ABC-type polysaccharide/polyol phosphate transport system ATPase subunit
VEQVDCHIRIRNLGVHFPRYIDEQPTLKKNLVRLLSGRWPAPTLFWALRHIDLEFDSGDRVGIIGKNGAGKSTLLKTVAGIYPPREGGLEVCGQLTALLELGTGFDMSRTVKENIYLGGVINGRSRKQMDDLLAHILDFAELKDFADTSVSQLSRGMQSRLAFSVATAIKPEILLLDEVFSVGDASFIRKARTRMGELVESCRILLFVSHAEDLVKTFCNKAVVLHEGKVKAQGNPSEIYTFYNAEIVGARYLCPRPRA